MKYELRKDVSDEDTVYEVIEHIELGSVKTRTPWEMRELDTQLLSILREDDIPKEERIRNAKEFLEGEWDCFLTLAGFSGVFYKCKTDRNIIALYEVKRNEEGEIKNKQIMTFPYTEEFVDLCKVVLQSNEKYNQLRVINKVYDLLRNIGYRYKTIHSDVAPSHDSFTITDSLGNVWKIALQCASEVVTVVMGDNKMDEFPYIAGIVDILYEAFYDTKNPTSLEIAWILENTLTENGYEQGVDEKYHIKEESKEEDEVEEIFFFANDGSVNLCFYHENGEERTYIRRSSNTNKEKSINVGYFPYNENKMQGIDHFSKGKRIDPIFLPQFLLQMDHEMGLNIEYTDSLYDGNLYGIPVSIYIEDDGYKAIVNKKEELVFDVSGFIAFLEAIEKYGEEPETHPEGIARIMKAMEEEEESDSTKHVNDNHTVYIRKEGKSKTKWNFCLDQKTDMIYLIGDGEEVAKFENKKDRLHSIEFFCARYTCESDHAFPIFLGKLLNSTDVYDITWICAPYVWTYVDINEKIAGSISVYPYADHYRIEALTIKKGNIDLCVEVPFHSISGVIEETEKFMQEYIQREEEERFTDYRYYILEKGGKFLSIKKYIPEKVRVNSVFTLDYYFKMQHNHGGFYKNGKCIGTFVTDEKKNQQIYKYCHSRRFATELDILFSLGYILSYGGISTIDWKESPYVESRYGWDKIEAYPYAFRISISFVTPWETINVFLSSDGLYYLPKTLDIIRSYINELNYTPERSYARNTRYRVYKDTRDNFIKELEAIPSTVTILDKEES